MENLTYITGNYGKYISVKESLKRKKYLLIIINVI